MKKIMIEKWMFKSKYGCLERAIKRFNRGQPLGLDTMRALARHYPEKLHLVLANGPNAERFRQNAIKKRLEATQTLDNDCGAQPGEKK